MALESAQHGSLDWAGQEPSLRDEVDCSLSSALGAASNAAESGTAESEPHQLFGQLWLSAGGQNRHADTGRLDRLLQESSIVECLRLWFGKSFTGTASELLRRLNRDIGVIDRLLTDQVNAIIHHPRFQQLEASWRGIQYLVEQVEDRGQQVEIKLLDVSAQELTNDLELAVEFDQSELFRKVYRDAFGTPGGKPFGVLIGDYEVRQRGASISPVDEARRQQQLDLSIVKRVAQVAAAAFCPFIACASPSLFGVDEFSALQHVSDPGRRFRELDYLAWRNLRDDPHTRFVGLTLPRVLMRLPYRDDARQPNKFRFAEDVSPANRHSYLWGSASFAFAGVLIRAFQESGWLAEIRGVRQDYAAGGLVTALPVHCFSTDDRGLVPKSSTDITITDDLEDQLSDLGFISLCHCKHTDLSAFHTIPSIQKPQQYDRLSATLNARISTMLPYVLCVSRFAHYLKVLARDRVGQFTGARECQSFLQNWIAKYVTADAHAPPQTKARLPLRKANVRVVQQAENPGNYDCVMQLWPHYALDELTGSIQVETTLASLDKS